MIKISLDKEFINSLFFDGLSGGKSQFDIENDHFTAVLAEKEFDGFLKENNLIPYKTLLKLYENGEIIGSFDTKS